jgi:predicted DNA-binding transcriptional regulator AlpA
MLASTRTQAWLARALHPASTVVRVGRKVDIEDLVDATEIAHRLGVKRPQVVHDWRRRHEDFPAPVAHLGNGNVWIWPEVASWARATGRLS